MPPTWWPETVTLDNYARSSPSSTSRRTSSTPSIVAVAVTVGNMVFCSMLGYALAKLDFPGKRALFAIVLGTLMVPGVVTFVPLFVLVTKMGLSNTLLGMILPFVAGPFGVFLMRQYILALPDELIQAARIDGAGRAADLRLGDHAAVRPGGGDAGHPDLPRRRGTTSSGRWSWPRPRTSTRCPSPWPSTPSGRTPPSTACCSPGSVVVVLPVLAIFLLLQRHIMQGIAMTGIK